MKSYGALTKLCLILLVATVVSAYAQLPLGPEDIPKVNSLLREHLQRNSLKCSVKQKKPTLDFALRFSAGYVIDCRVVEFEDKETLLTIYTRITPTGKEPSLLGDAYRLPVITAAMLGGTTRKQWKKHFLFEMSGGFAVGEGAYLVEVLVVDDRNRRFRKEWNVKAGRSGRERSAQRLIEPNTVEPLVEFPEVDQPAGRGKGLRLTILLDAAPFYPSQAALRAWDSAFLLNSVWSLLRQTPCRSVRVVAFNLDQQEEIFRQDQFDRAALMRLNRALQDLELATVSVQILQQQGHESELLANLVNQEVEAKEASDAVVFLGPMTRFEHKIPPEMLKHRSARNPQFFNFAYVPWWYRAHLPDIVENLTHALHGATYEIHSPDEFAKAIQKMLEALKQN